MHVYLSSVDLPPMLGPVTKSSVYRLPVSIRVSFGMKFFWPVIVTQGCTIYLMSMYWRVSPSLKLGRHIGVSDWPLTIARDARQSSSVSTLRHYSHTLLCE